MVTQTAFNTLAGSVLLIAIAVLFLNWGLDRTRRDVKKLTVKK